MRIVAVLFLIVPLSALGQCLNCEEGDGGKFCYGADKETTRLHAFKFIDYARQDRSIEALPELLWLIDNAPCLNICFYTGAEKYSSKVIDSSKDKPTRKKYKTAMKQLKELRESYFSGQVPSGPCWY